LALAVLDGGMNVALALGLVLTLAGLVAYVVGILTPYPARSLSVTAVIVGITLAAVGRSDSRGGTA